MKTLKYSIIRAIDNPSVANLFARNHSTILKLYNVEPTSANDQWILNPDSYMFIATCDDKMIGGMRLDVETDFYSMPLLRSLKDRSPELISYVSKFKIEEIGEVCAWWIEKEFAGDNIPSKLLEQGMAYAKELGLKEILGFPHQYTIKIMTDLGFSRLDVVGDQGSFHEFPDERYTSTVVKLKT